MPQFRIASVQIGIWYYIKLTHDTRKCRFSPFICLFLNFFTTRACMVLFFTERILCTVIFKHANTLYLTFWYSIQRTANATFHIPYAKPLTL